MPIQVTHGPSQGTYGGVVADRSQRESQQEWDKEFMEFLAQLREQNRAYKLGTRGLDIDQGRLDLSGEELDHRKYVDVENLGLSRDDLSLRRELGLADVDIRQQGVDLNKDDQRLRAELAMLQLYGSNPAGYIRAYGGEKVSRPGGGYSMQPTLPNFSYMQK